jgi:DNA transformation protein
MADELTEYALELFEPLGGVSSRRMFGGVGFFKSKLMFGLIAYDELHLKTDENTIPEFEEHGCKPFAIDKGGKQVNTGYWTMPEHLHDDEEERERWVRRAFDIAIKADAAKPPSQRKLK